MRKTQFNFWHSLFLMVFLLSIFAATSFAQEISCTCEKITCGPCETEIDIEFYTNKCGPAQSKIKSCKKPVCEPVVEQDVCLAKLNLNLKKPAIDELAKNSRLPASLEIPVGAVEICIGNVELISANGGTARKCEKDAKVFENDRVVTTENAKVKIIFYPPADTDAKLRDELHINSKSSILIEKYRHPSDDVMNRTAQKTLVTLNFGKMRARVNQKYDNLDRRFEIRTKSAVVGVRGTDFVMSYDEEVKSTKLETLSGAVEIIAQNSGVNTGSPLLVSAGQSAGAIFRADIFQLTPIQEVDPKTLRNLDQMTEVKNSEKEASLPAKAVDKKDEILAAKNSEALCTNPAADFKKCAWFCENNPAGEKKCRIDLKEVSCVRKMCGAGGKWTLPSRMPSSRGEECDGQHPVVRECGQFW